MQIQLSLQEELINLRDEIQKETERLHQDKYGGGAWKNEVGNYVLLAVAALVRAISSCCEAGWGFLLCVCVGA
jgi:hypothetical protein